MRHDYMTRDNRHEQLKRKRTKLECLECHSVFDDDYLKRHEQICHQGKRVRVAHKDAPANPFEAAIGRRKSQGGAKSQDRQEDPLGQEHNKEVLHAKESEDSKSITTRRVDGQAGTAAVLSLQQFYRKQLREFLESLLQE